MLVREKAVLDKVGQRFFYVNTRNLLSRSLKQCAGVTWV